ncbi:MAG: restriction endonuclease subunit S [Fusobacterium sp.]
MEASLNKKLNNIEWGEYKIENLFEKLKTKTLNYKTADLPNYPTKDYILPALTAGIQNQGLNNYVPNENATILERVISISANGANTGATFFQKNKFTVLQDAYAIDVKSEIISNLSDNQYLFLVAAISKTIYGNFAWTNKAGWEKVKKEYIQLPIKNNKIDFEFMESFIAELEAQRIAELEAQRIAELEAYLTITGLKDYILTTEEEKILDKFKNIDLKELNITNIFEIKNTKNILSKDIVPNSGNIPYLCASAENNGVSTYIIYKDELIEKGNCIFIGGKTFVVSYQEKDFYSNDSHNLVLYLKNQKITRSNQLFLATCIKKSLSHKYSWGNSISNSKIKSDIISIPKFNFEEIEVFISAISKLVIKDLVLYKDKKIELYKKSYKNI